MASEQQETPRSPGTELGRTYGGAAKARQPRRAFASEFRDAATAHGEAAVEWMTARPVTGAAIGLGIGVLIGLAIGRSIR